MADDAGSPLVLPEGSWWDWEIIACDPVRLRLAAGYDLTYHHGLELVFHEPEFVACPTSFHDPVFRAPTETERTRLVNGLAEPPPVLVAFDADANGAEPIPCLIAAGRLEVVHQLVTRNP
ncbi:hypothetical protein LX16_5072 [Stackebrandtia albiflava]|uniref:Uncharacterized protein n=1 Tax=Stackebrandtia albiflava TaxID=406432 RepID=A0A562UPR5_9ACTN|nr:hypothetical protein [Stackebrandtia albiflava]TWJ07586.1 hypothetical protein LX16_5072 [Stackebrandtia albiflava]